MCGRLNLVDSPGVQQLCDQLDITLWPDTGRVTKRFARATDRVSIVLKTDNGCELRNAIWWLLLEPPHNQTASHFVPSKYTSFNTRYDKLDIPGSAGFHAFRQQRCIIPATGFGETQKVGATTVYHDLIASNDTPLALGGLYREWRYWDALGNRCTETSCSVVTLAPHPKLMPIHQKASPLMLSFHDGSVTRWLDCEHETAESLCDLIVPCVRHHFTVVPIDKPSQYNPIGATFSIKPD